MMNLHSPDWARRYEELRAQTVGSRPALDGQAWGLAVLVQRGMRRWMEAWQTPAPKPGGPVRSTTGLPPLQDPPAAAVLLTNMVVRALGLSL